MCVVGGGHLDRSSDYTSKAHASRTSEKKKASYMETYQVVVMPHVFKFPSVVGQRRTFSAILSINFFGKFEDALSHLLVWCAKTTLSWYKLDGFAKSC